MSITIETLRTRVRTRIRADLATPTVSDLNETSITTWANEKATEVIHLLKDSVHFPALIVPNATLTFTNGSVALPSSPEYDMVLSVMVTVSGSLRHPDLYFEKNEFNRLDSRNFILTPSEDLPAVLVADKIYVKPTTITAGQIDYVRSHPDIGANGTLWDELGDRILVELIVSEYFGSVVHDVTLAANAREIAKSIAEDK